MSSTPVRMILKWSVPQGESRNIVSALQSIMLTTRAEAGCIGCSLTTEVNQNVLIRYIEEWSSESYLISQLRSDKFADLAELMERASEYPSIEFVLGTATRGIDYVTEVRRTGSH